MAARDDSSWALHFPLDLFGSARRGSVRSSIIATKIRSADCPRVADGRRVLKCGLCILTSALPSTRRSTLPWASEVIANRFTAVLEQGNYEGSPASQFLLGVLAGLLRSAMRSGSGPDHGYSGSRAAGCMTLVSGQSLRAWCCRSSTVRAGASKTDETGSRA